MITLADIQKIERAVSDAFENQDGQAQPVVVALLSSIMGTLQSVKHHAMADERTAAWMKGGPSGR